MKCKRKSKFALFLATLAFLASASFNSAYAMHFSPNDNTTIDVDATVNYGGGWRVSEPDGDNLLNPNTDDAHRNFDQWDMINNKFSLLADIDIKFKNAGLFVRPKAFYDQVYMTDNSNDSPATNNALLGGLVNDSDEWADDVEDVHGANAKILDLFGYGNFSFADRFIGFRVGRQMISWGTSLLISGGVSSAQSHMDLSAATAVGTEVKEIYLPSESVYLQVDLTDHLSLASYYQWKWYSNVLFEGGTFFSPSDFLDEIKAPIIAGPGILLPRGDDDEPKDSGQYGVGLTFKPPWALFNATELGLYYINYHDKMPNPVVGFPYFLTYTEDIKLYGLSFDTAVGATNVAGEFSYREDYGFSPTEKANYYQTQVSAVYAMGLGSFADLANFVGEIGCAREIGRADDTFAWKYIVRSSLNYYQVMKGLDMTFTLAYGDTPSGTNVIGTEGSASGSIGFDFIYKNVYKAGITYENRFNERRNVYEDRDTLALKMSYTF